MNWLLGFGKVTVANGPDIAPGTSEAERDD